MERNAEELLNKVRKGATAGFNIKDWQCVLDAIGWAVEKKPFHKREFTYTVTAPDGETFLIMKPAGYRAIVFYDFIPWAKKHGLMEAVDAKLGPAPIKPTRQELEANTGTCPCCFGGFKLRTKAGGTEPIMVLHGYLRPGNGYIDGNCYGVGYQPYELSCDGTKAFLEIVERRRAQLDEALKYNMSEPEEVSESYRDNDAPNGIRRNVYTKADAYNYKRVLDGILDRINRELKRAIVDAAFYGKKIVDWVYAPEALK